MSVSDKDILSAIEHSGRVVKGVGGSQAIGKEMECSFVLNCIPERTFSHAIKPSIIPGEPSLVLLGTDFLSKFNLTVFDWENNKVLIGDTWVYYSTAEAGTSPHLDISTQLTNEQFVLVKDTIEKYADSIFVHNPKAPKRSSLGTHTISLESKLPHKDKVRRLPQKWREAVDKQVNEMLQNDIIRESSSPFSSNPVMVTKKDDTKRFCVDFRSLNTNTIKDTYPLPNVDELLDQFKGCNYFSQLDLASGYWGIPMHPEDIEKTAFVAPRGKYEFIVMPYGLANAQATFQRGMDNLVKDLHEEGHKDVEAYVDNLVVYSTSFEQHLATLERLLHYVDHYNLSLRPDKCEFAKPEIEFLGFLVNGETIRPTHANVSKVLNFPKPTTRKKLQSFLGIANFNRRFIKGYSKIAQPLTKLTSSKKKFEWGVEQDGAFEQIKNCISKAPSLRLADWSKEFHIETDASDIAVGAVLFQLGESGEQFPLAYHSKTLTDTERRWSATDKEMFGIISAARKWSPYCSGSVVFHTDHQPLKFMRKQKDPRGKMARWLVEMENFDYRIEYIPGKDNVQADYLSRVEIPSSEKEVESTQEKACVYFEDVIVPTLDIIKAHQLADPSIADAMEQLDRVGEVSKGNFRSYPNLEIDNGMLWKGERIVIPESLQEVLLTEYHGQYHPGVENTTLMLKSRFYWRGMEKKVREFVSRCRTCIQTKVSKVQHSDTQLPELPKCRERLCIDIACMPKSNRGKQYILQMIDANTKFIATAALDDQQAETIRKTLWPKWFATFGVPRSLLSDQGKNVDGKVIRDLCKKLNIIKIHSSPYHPEGNGSTERSIGSIKSIVRAMCESRGVAVENWDLLLDEATLAYNNTVNKSSGFSPFKSMFGSNAILPIDTVCGINPTREEILPKLVQTNADKNRGEAQAGYKARLDRKCNTVELAIGDTVLLKRTFGDYPKLSVKWKEDKQGNPYIVVKKVGPVNYAIRNSDGLEKVYHRNMLRPAVDRRDASFRATGKPQAEDPIPRTSSSSVVITQSVPARPAIGIDRQALTDNFFRTGPDVQAPAVPSAEAAAPTTSRYGRTYKPVSRLIDELNPG